jgi:hypothetical protein
MSWAKDWPDERVDPCFEKLKRALDVRWCLDPAASGPRARAFLGDYELVIYLEDGAWYLHREGDQVAGGANTETFDVGMKRLVAVYKAFIATDP